MRRRQASQELRIVKFVEAFWRFLFYAFFTIVGFFTLVFKHHLSFFMTSLDW